jgi:hypothetical protein
MKSGKDYILIISKNKLLSLLKDSVVTIVKTIVVITNLLSISKI